MVTKEERELLLRKIEEEKLREIAAAMTQREREIFLEVWKISYPDNKAI